MEETKTRKYELKYFTIRRGKQKIGEIPCWVEAKVESVDKTSNER